MKVHLAYRYTQLEGMSWGGVTKYREKSRRNTLELFPIAVPSCDHPETSHINSPMTEFITITKEEGRMLLCPFYICQAEFYCRESNHNGRYRLFVIIRILGKAYLRKVTRDVHSVYWKWMQVLYLRFNAHFVPKEEI